MKTFIVYAERTILEALEIKARTESEALEMAINADNEGWQTEADIDWQITTAQQVTEE
jgi:hypothetical protein